jgi:hypothetical protein
MHRRYVPTIFTMMSWCHRLREGVASIGVDILGAEKAMVSFFWVQIIELGEAWTQRLRGVE